MDIINLEILEDGMISIKTEGISETNHKSADELLEDLLELIGGEVTREHNPRGKKMQKIYKQAHTH